MKAEERTIAEECTINEIADKVSINRKSVMLCLNYESEVITYCLKMGNSFPGRQMNNRFMCFLMMKTRDTGDCYNYFDEINKEPVIFHWKYNLEDIDVSEEVIVDSLPIESPVNYRTMYWLSFISDYSKAGSFLLRKSECLSGVPFFSSILTKKTENRFLFFPFCDGRINLSLCFLQKYL